MNPHSLEHVSNWLEDDPSDGPAFVQGLDWAFRLSLPLHAVVTSRCAPQHSRDRHVQIPPNQRLHPSDSPLIEKMKAWGVACTDLGIAFEIYRCPDDGKAGINRFLLPHGLCVFANKQTSSIQEQLLRRSATCRDNAVLLCASPSGPINRMLVLNSPHTPKSGFMESVARFCHALEIHPVILISAKSEQEAAARQEKMEEVCHAQRLVADFDVVIGSDLCSAVSRVAKWRRCSHLVVERQSTGSWWSRTGGDLLEQFRGLADSLSILALPEAVTLDVPHRIQSEPWGLLNHAAEAIYHPIQK